MINWGPRIDVPRAYQLAEEASAAITELLRTGAVPGASKPLLASAAAAVTLANEKVYTPYLLIQKKNYAAMKYTLKASRKPEEGLDAFDCEMDMKGIDAVRRDRTKLVKALSADILDAILIKCSLEAAIGALKGTLDRVVRQEAPIEWFVLSKSLKSRYPSENLPHVQAWRRMQARGDNDVPEIGTRMAYVVTIPAGPRSTRKLGPLYERTEHPDYVTLAKLSYDSKYYLENAQDVIERLLGPTGEGPRVRGFFAAAIEAAENTAAGTTANRSLLAFRSAAGAAAGAAGGPADAGGPPGLASPPTMGSKSPPSAAKTKASGAAGPAGGSMSLAAFMPAAKKARAS
jgi:hypothetical protein